MASFAERLVNDKSYINNHCIPLVGGLPSPERAQGTRHERSEKNLADLANSEQAATSRFPFIIVLRPLSPFFCCNLVRNSIPESWSIIRR